jgi:lysophospholipase L1-like esterase
MFLGIGLVTAICMLTGAAGAGELPPRLQPTRIHSIGDSITVAFDSNFLFINPSESWVNGYYGVDEELYGFEDVYSHSQRADAAFGVVSNVNGGRSGEGMAGMWMQALGAVSTTPYYVTVELGGNDVCRDSAFDVPMPRDVALDFLDGVLMLDPSIVGFPGGLTPGATVYVASIPDVKQLYDVAKDQTGLFGLDCETIWLTTTIGFPCGSMLAPYNTEATRLAVQAANYEYNRLLEIVVDMVVPLSSNVYWEYTWSVWNHPVQGNEISSIDCFHPSSDGQRALSEITWSDGPFSAF